MPYKLVKSGDGYTVVNSETGRKHSNKPLPRSRAVAQMRALYAAENGTSTKAANYGARAGETGLAEKTADGSYQLTTAGRSYVRAANRGNVDQARRALEKGQRAVETATTTKSTWSTATVNTLPDSAFLYVESGEKDADGKTTPRSKRHFPVKDANGKVDAAHLRNAIARIPQSNAPGLNTEAVQKRARAMLERLNSSITTKEAGHTGVMLAFFLPALVANELASQTSAAGVTTPEPVADLHLTLAYLGKITDLADSKYQILAGAERYARYASAVIGSISGIGRFEMDEGDGTNALYASVDAPDLSAWRDNLIQELANQSGTLPAANHGYTPHITLAYVPADAPTPTIPIGQIPVTFDTLTLAWGDERVSFPLLRSSPMVFKDKNDRWRWVTFSSTAYRDRDGEIVSTKALADDVARADADGDYGPLRWWHMPGVDIGDCDFNAVTGRVLVESGTFRDERVGERIKAAAPDLQVSIGFHHAPTEPVDGVFSSIRRFERSLLPAGRASNPYTRLLVQETPSMDQPKQDALKSIVGDELLAQLLTQADATTKAADAAGVAFKEAEPAAAAEIAVEDGMDDEGVAVGDMSPEEFGGLLKASNQPLADALGMLAQAITSTTTKAAAVETRLAEVETKAAETAATAAVVPSLQTELETTKAALQAALGQLAELKGDLPKSVNERRASQSTATVITPEQTAQYKSDDAQPRGDPNFINSFVLGQPVQQGA